MNLVVTVADSRDEFKDIVVADSQKLDKGTVTFEASDPEIAIFRPLSQDLPSVRYVWVKNYQEMRKALDRDGFRILSKKMLEEPAENKKAPSLGLVFTIACVIVMGLLLFLGIKDL